MKKYEFYALCGEHLIDINIALENEQLIDLLKNRASYKAIEQCLIEQF